jgi:hypothetical protein
MGLSALFVTDGAVAKSVVGVSMAPAQLSSVQSMHQTHMHTFPEIWHVLVTQFESCVSL